MHLASRHGGKSADQEVAERRTRVRAAAFPATENVVVLGDQVRGAQKLRSGNALRKSVMNALMSSWPRRGACTEYCSSMSGAASSSTIARSQVLPQKCVNHRRRS